MDLIRVLLCILLPPLAVLDRGCGSILIVTILTIFGWIPGVLGALIICINKQDGPKAASSGPVDYFSPPVRPMSFWKPFMDAIPKVGPYEPEATSAQLNRLWKMGLTDQSFLDGLGRTQASWLITNGMNSQLRNSSIIVLSLILIGGAILTLFWLATPNDAVVKPARAPAKPIPTPVSTPTPTPQPTPTPFSEWDAIVPSDVPFSTTYGNMTIPERTVVRVVGKDGVNSIVRWNGHDVQVPSASLRPVGSP